MKMQNGSPPSPTLKAVIPDLNLKLFSDKGSFVDIGIQ